MAELTLGVIGHARKENEQRAPIHPDHIAGIPADLRARMVFERGYGERFGVSDAQIAALCAGAVDRAAVFDRDIVLLPKPTAADFDDLREGQILWGWPHCVQGPAITQVAIDRRMTMIAWEEMHHWDGERFHLHVFHQNNELAGYCSVLHALALSGTCGHYGPPRRAAVIGFGSVGRGAVHALKGQGFTDLTLFTPRPPHAVRAPIPGARRVQYRPAAEAGRVEVDIDGRWAPMSEALSAFNVIVNGILQDTDRPLTYLKTSELGGLRRRALIVDVSCDEGMGFEFARPTSFAEPWFGVGDRGARYYAVDHSPSYLWEAATHSISTALLPFLRPVMDGPDGWAASRPLSRAIEIRDGVVQNPKILRFQGREAAYPHPSR